MGFTFCGIKTTPPALQSVVDSLAQRLYNRVIVSNTERTMFNLYPGRIADGFYELIEEIAPWDIDLIEFLLGDGQ
jgi:hypothetical protein